MIHVISIQQDDIFHCLHINESHFTAVSNVKKRRLSSQYWWCLLFFGASFILVNLLGPRSLQLICSPADLREGYMAPYRKTRYHFKQFDAKGPENLNEILTTIIHVFESCGALIWGIEE